MLAIGLVLLVAAALWRPVAVPQLARFPSHVDETTHYAGTFTLHADQATLRPLEEPVTVPLEIDRRVHTLPGGGARTAVVEEAVSYRIAEVAQEERHHYVIDRRSMQHRDDGRSWSFSPDNRIDDAGSYRVTLPMGTTTDARYRIWENEPGRSFWMERDPDRAHVRQNGLDLIGLQEVWHGAPVASYYRNELRKQGFPVELTFSELTAGLAADGIDVDRALDTLPAEDAPVVAAARESRLPLRFFRDNDGHALVEPRTGEIVDLVYSEEAITATLDLAPLRDLRTALSRQPGSADVTSLAGALDAMTRAPPTRVYSLRYEQTAGSVAEAAARARDDLRMLDLVERYIPGGLAGMSAVLLAAGAIGCWRARRRPMGRSPERTAAGATLPSDGADPVGSHRERGRVQLRPGSGSS